MNIPFRRPGKIKIQLDSFIEESEKFRENRRDLGLLSFFVLLPMGCKLLFLTLFPEGKGAVTAFLQNSLPTFQLYLFQCQIFIAWGTLWAAVKNSWPSEHGEIKCRRKHILDEGRIRTPVWHWKDIWELSKFDLLWDFEKMYMINLWKTWRMLLYLIWPWFFPHFVL